VAEITMLDAVPWQKQMPNKSVEPTPEKRRGSRWAFGRAHDLW